MLLICGIFKRVQPLAGSSLNNISNAVSQGTGDWVEPRQRSLEYKDFIQRLMKFHDGRFAQHPRFPYVAFNLK